MRIPLQLLKTQVFGRTMRSFQTLNSTNLEAQSWASEGAPEGSVVYAELQSGGRGRLGRKWIADAGVNLTFSVVLRPAFPVHRFGLITLAASIAVAQTIQAIPETGLVQIKWPNDVYLDGKKCCGILAETSSSGSNNMNPTVVVLGIGLNINQARFPKILAANATSLFLSTGKKHTRESIFADILLKLEKHYQKLQKRQFDDVLYLYQKLLKGLNENISIHQLDGTRINGIFYGVDNNGSLILKTATGYQHFHAGEISFQKETMAL